DEIAITRNATEGLAVVIKGLDLKPGDEIVHSFHEHQSNIQPWRLQAKRYGVVLKEVSFGTPPETAEEILNRFNDALGPRTRVITFPHCTTYTGCLLPVKELADLAKAKGVLCLVDGAHPLGMMKLNLRELGIDTFASTCHKWLCSPAGTGLLFVRDELTHRIWPNIVTNGWDTVRGARKYEKLSRRPWPQVVVLEDALDFQIALGRERIEKRVRDLATYLRNGLAEIPGVTLFTSNAVGLAAGLTTFALDRKPGGEIHDHLLSRHNVWVPRLRAPASQANRGEINGIRVSTHFFNNQGEIDRLLEGVRELAGRK
ncbi:MAG TPA: aminotransferase class V-fold PLP-dependent enzyme, partial [Bacteroidota bacterium]